MTPTKFITDDVPFSHNFLHRLWSIQESKLSSSQYKIQAQIWIILWKLQLVFFSVKLGTNHKVTNRKSADLLQLLSCGRQQAQEPWKTFLGPEIFFFHWSLIQMTNHFKVFFIYVLLLERSDLSLNNHMNLICKIKTSIFSTEVW